MFWIDDIEIFTDVFTNTSTVESENTFNIYPNPAQAYLQVENTSNNIFENIKILDLTGKSVKEINSSYINIQDAIIDISELESGVYLSKIGNKTKKCIKR